MQWVEADVIDGGEAFGNGRRFELFVGGDDGAVGDARLAAARSVAGEGIGERRVEIIGDALEMRDAGGREVFCPRGGGGVGVVDDAGLLCLQAGVKEQRFAVAGAQHVEVKADVRVGKMRFVITAFAGCLDAAKKDELHGGMVSLVFPLARRLSMRHVVVQPIFAVLLATGADSIPPTPPSTAGFTLAALTPPTG